MLLTQGTERRIAHVLHGSEQEGEIPQFQWADAYHFEGRKGIGTGKEDSRSIAQYTLARRLAIILQVTLKTTAMIPASTSYDKLKRQAMRLMLTGKVEQYMQTLRALSELRLLQRRLA